MLSPDFLLRDALVGSVLVGMVCPLVGVYFVLRRMIFLGVALPQLSAAGIAFAFLAYRTSSDRTSTSRSASACSRWSARSGFTLGGLLVLAALERRGRETVEARIGATYAHRRRADDPLPRRRSARRSADGQPAEGRHPGHHRDGPHGARVASSALSSRRCSRFARSSCSSRSIATWRSCSASAPALWDTLLYLVSGVTISLGVMTAGPIVTFGFLVIPPLTARLVTRHMLAFSLASSVDRRRRLVRRLLLRVPLRSAARARGGGGRERRARGLAGAANRLLEVVSAASLALLHALRRRGARARDARGCARRRSSLGATAATAATVLASYFAGLGLGAAVRAAKPRRIRPAIRRPRARPRPAALWSCAVFSAAPRTPAGAARARSGRRARAQWLVVSLAILPATFCLGATLPTLGHGAGDAARPWARAAASSMR